ncbi:MAG: NAD+ synthase [Candidatus Margulisbacteria bacterium]|jgi:NAD+ synthase|nr:NAD+ synthase [Candidatus Margulisiibacteriota bacterium]
MDTAQTVAILLNFLREEIKKTGLHKAVLGLSGGIDSAVVCALCAGALGADNVRALCLPYKTSHPESEAHARLCAETYGVPYQVIEITPQIDAYFEHTEPDAPPLRRGNKMARERMAILYDHSAKLGGLVVGTSNKTELLLGYGTQHGDLASALNPIGDIYKTDIFALAGRLKVPEPIIKKTPSADLWAGQSDEAELGYTYARIDELLAELIDRRISERALKEKYDPVFVDKIITLVKKSQFKRRLPLIAKLSARTIDREFRYPRDWGV